MPKKKLTVANLPAPPLLKNDLAQDNTCDLFARRVTDLTQDHTFAQEKHTLIQRMRPHAAICGEHRLQKKHNIYLILMKTPLLLSLLAASFLFFACKCEEPGEGFTHFYTETQCADPWAGEVNTVGLENAITTYLADSGIQVLDFREVMDSTKISFCQACICGTGRTMEVKVSSADGLKLENLVVPDYNQWTRY